MKWFQILFSRKKEMPPVNKPEAEPEDKSETQPVDKPEAKPAENPQPRPAQEWRYGVAGNITKTHFDEQGILRYGTSAFSGGTKVYLCGEYWTKGQKTILVIGLSRCRRVVYSEVPTELIENVRCTKVYKPAVLDLMGDIWWDNSVASKKGTMRFVELWNEK
ncbi:MAG: hypothetical protein IJ412_11345 [Oscillospiraceae bacterium]|nr:hypothetical protein [Oscillospiraceae bacterium]